MVYQRARLTSSYNRHRKLRGAAESQAVRLTNKRNRDESLAATVALIDALQLGGGSIGDGQFAESPQAIHLTDQERLQPPSAGGVIEDLSEMSQSGHYLAVVEELALLSSLLPEERAGTDGVLAVPACIGAVLVEDPGLLRASRSVEVRLAQGSHVLIAGMPIQLLGLAPSGM